MDRNQFRAEILVAHMQYIFLTGEVENVLKNTFIYFTKYFEYISTARKGSLCDRILSSKEAALA